MQAIRQLTQARHQGESVAVVCLCSPKGGVGKSTSATVLATELAARGIDVSIIDADPNRPLVRWSRLPNAPKRVDVTGDVSETTILDVIEQHQARVPVVIVDLEGTRSLTTSYALSMANLAIIPCQGSDLDAVQAFAAVKEVKMQSRVSNRSIPYAVVFTRTSAAIQPRTLKAIESDLAENNVPVFNVRLHERDAFRAMHSFGGSLRSLDPKDVRNLDAAIANASAFASEVLDRLRREQDEAA